VANIKGQVPNAQGKYPFSLPSAKRSSDDWVKDLLELKEYSNRKRYAAWTRWNEAWRLYNNQYDFSTKARWQSRNFVPKISMTVEMAASLVRRAMLDANEWFRYEGTTETSRTMAPYLEKLAYYYLDELRFIDRFVPPLKGGFVGSLIVLKTHLAPYILGDETEEDVERRMRGEKAHRKIIEGPAITVSYPDPYDIWLDPTGREMYVIEEEVMDYAMAADLVDMGVFDSEEFGKMDEDWVDTEKETRESQRKQQSSEGGKPSFRTELKLTHFWGSLPRKQGRWAIKNGHFVIANDKYLLRKPMDNPYGHKKSPYVIGSPFRRPFSVYHKGLIEDVVGLQKAMTELLNLTLDSTLFSGIKAFEIDLDQVEDPQQILNGIYPGKVFTARKGGQNTEMVKTIKMDSVSRDLVSIYQMTNEEYQNNTAVTEFISGLQGGAGRTATEVVTKTQQGMGIFSEIARNLEGSVLEPMLERVGALIVDFHEDFTSDKVWEILGPDLAMELMISAPDMRAKKFEANNMRVRASGITSLLNREQEIQKIGALLQNLGQFGEMLPLMLSDIDTGFFFKNIFKRMIRAFGWNEKDLIRPKTEEQKAAEAAAQVAGGGTTAPAAGGAPPAATPGAPLPPAVSQTMGQMDQLIAAAAGGGFPPNPMVQ